MKKASVLIIFVLITLSLSAQKKIAYYIIDSLSDAAIEAMPSYSTFIDTVSSYQIKTQVKLMRMKAIHEDSLKDFREDSAKLVRHPETYVLRKENLEKMKTDYDSVVLASDKELVLLDSIYRGRLLSELQSAAEKVAQENGCDEVYEHSQAQALADQQGTSVQLVNITAALQEELLSSLKKK